MLMGTTARAASISSTETCDRPTWRTSPSSRQLRQRAVLLVGRHPWVDAVQLEEVDPLDTQATQAHQALLAEVLRATDRLPDVGAVTGEACLRGDHEAIAVRVQRLADQSFGDLGSVRVRGVDEVHAQPGQRAQDLERSRGVGRLAPDARTGDPHGTEAEPGHGDVAADREGGGGGVGPAHVDHRRPSHHTSGRGEHRVSHRGGGLPRPGSLPWVGACDDDPSSGRSGRGAASPRATGPTWRLAAPPGRRPGARRRSPRSARGRGGTTTGRTDGARCRGGTR